MRSYDIIINLCVVICQKILMKSHVLEHDSPDNWKNEILSLNSCNFCKHEKFQLKLSGIVGYSFPFKLQNFRRKSSIGCEDIAFSPVVHFFLSHPVYIPKVNLLMGKLWHRLIPEVTKINCWLFADGWCHVLCVIVEASELVFTNGPLALIWTSFQWCAMPSAAAGISFGI